MKAVVGVRRLPGACGWRSFWLIVAQVYCDRLGVAARWWSDGAERSGSIGAWLMGLTGVMGVRRGRLRRSGCWI